MKYTAAVLLMLLVCGAVWAGVQYDPVQREAFPTTQQRYNGDFTGAQTNLELIAGVSGKQWVIDYITFSFATAGTIYFLEGGSGVYGPWACIANDTKYLPNCNVRFSSGEGIDLTTSLAGVHRVSIEYHQE